MAQFHASTSVRAHRARQGNITHGMRAHPMTISHILSHAVQRLLSSLHDEPHILTGIITDTCLRLSVRAVQFRPWDIYTPATAGPLMDTRTSLMLVYSPFLAGEAGSIPAGGFFAFKAIGKI